MISDSKKEKVKKKKQGENKFENRVQQGRNNELVVRRG